MTFLFRIYRGTLQSICLVDAPNGFTKRASNYIVLEQWYMSNEIHKYTIGQDGSAIVEMFRDEKGMIKEIFTNMKR